MKKIILFLIIFCSFFSKSYAVDFDLGGTDNLKSITDISIDATSENTFNDGIEESINNVLKTFKIIISGLFILFIVYSGIMMIISMGENEEDIKKSKQSIGYATIGLLFINVPGTIYNSFSGKGTTDDISWDPTTAKMDVVYKNNLFMNSGVFGNTIGTIVDIFQILLVAIAVIIIVYQGIKIIMSLGKSDALTEPKNKIMYGVMGLIFVGVMEVWRNIVFTGNIKEGGAKLFGTLGNIALYFAAPTAIVFISWAGYLYLTSNGNEDNIKKAKSILINTFIGIIILIGIFTFFKDLDSLSF